MEGRLGRGDPQPFQDTAHALEEAVGAIQDAESFQRWLTISARFPRYSWGNQLLIALQMPTASRVMGYGDKQKRHGWLSLGRQVRRGEKAIKIQAPITRRVGEDEDGKGVYKTVGFTWANVFDILQTDGTPLPHVDVPILEGEAGTELWEGLSTLTRQEGILLRTAPVDQMPRQTMGYYLPYKTPKEIVVGEYSQLQKTKTLAHELGHHVGGFDDSTKHNETLAEVVAWIVCQHFGVDTSERSIPYIATWSQDRKVLREVMETGQRASRYIIERVEALHLGEPTTPATSTLDTEGFEETPDQRAS